MKKLLLIPLLALFTCVNMWAGVTVSNPNAGGLNGDYDSFAAAIDAISANKTAGHVITLNDDQSTAMVFGTKTQYISEINLNGHELTASGYIALQNSKSLYVHDGTVKCTSANLAFSLSAQSQTLTLERITQDASSTGKALYNLPSSQKYNVQALVQVGSGGVVEIDNQSNVSVYCSTGYPTLSNSTIHNNGSGTTYFYNQIVSDNALGTRISGGFVTGNVVLAPQLVYEDAVYDAVKTYIPEALKDKKYLTLYLANSGLVPVYKFNTTEATLTSAITINETEYKFTGITTYGTQEHPAKLIQNFNGGQWIAGGYIDLNGHTWSIGTSGNTPAIKPTAGKTLTIVNSQPATGCIQINGNYSASQYAMTLLTTATAPANNSVLTIGEGVVVNMPNVQGYALAVFAKSGDAGYGTIFNLNGTINVQNGAGLCINGTLKNSANKANSPVFNIAGTINAKDAAIYAAGYGEWNINDGANLSGKSGIQIKSGKLNINDGAIVHATGEGSRVPAYNNGMIESGAALQIESNSAYAGDMEIAIADDATLIADAWYAIHEYVAESNDPTAVKSIAVTGGHFQGGILLSQSLAATGGFVSGGKWSVDVTANVVKGKVANPIDEDPYFFEVGDPTPATAEIVNDPSKNAVLTNEDGETYASTYTSEAVGDDAEVKTTTANNQVVVSENTDVVVDDTDENNSTIVEVKKVTVEGDAELNIKEGATLIVGSGSVLLDESTTTGGLTVEAGAALVVDGLVYGATEDNFVIEGQEEKSGIVLFSPETEFVKEDHPTATYRFTSKSFKDGSKWVYQRFGMPSFDGNVTVKEGEGTASSVRSFICTWDYTADDWGAWSELNKTTGLSYDAAVPFQCYQIGSDNAKAEPVTYDFVVALMGNANAPLNFKAGWNPYANSYTAPIDIKEFLTDVIANTSADIQATIYLYKDLGNDTYTWQGINLGNVGKTYRVRENGAMVKKTYDASIEPMQAFIMKLASGDDATTDINYLNNVYNPAMGIDRPSAAPARNRASYNEMQIGVFNDLYWDNISIMEGEQFSADLDNGYDACKYDRNNSVSLYVINGATRMERIATDDAEGLMIGIDAPVAGQYTLDFSNVNGEEFAIIDMTNNALINVVEDGQYTFYAEEGANNYRFQIVKANKMPTAIDNVEATAAIKGIYTITGQFVGFDFNRVPAGVYVVNGVKVVK